MEIEESIKKIQKEREEQILESDRLFEIQNQKFKEADEKIKNFIDQKPKQQKSCECTLCKLCKLPDFDINEYYAKEIDKEIEKLPPSS